MAIRTDADGIRKVFPEVDLIQDAALRQGVVDIWLDIAAESPWEGFEGIPKNLGEEKHMTLVGHIRGVTKAAIAMADFAAEHHGLKLDRDLLLAACLLHDITKPLESRPDPGGSSLWWRGLACEKDRIRRQDPARRLRRPQDMGEKTAQGIRTCPSGDHPHPRERHALPQLRGRAPFLRRLGGFRRWDRHRRRETLCGAVDRGRMTLPPRSPARGRTRISSIHPGGRPLGDYVERFDAPGRGNWLRSHPYGLDGTAHRGPSRPGSGTTPREGTGSRSCPPAGMIAPCHVSPAIH